MAPEDVHFQLSADVASAFPEAEIRFVLARGLSNDVPWADVAEKVDDLEKRIADESWRPFTEKQPEIASWHDAYRRFGTNPRRLRPSLDALSRRLGKNGVLPRINPAVDSYNLVSVTYGTPAGAFDTSSLRGLVEIRFSESGDEFSPLGEPDKRETPNPGEVVYAQAQTVLTRHWNYRDADQTKVTKATHTAVFIIERISADAVPSARMDEAQAALAELLRPHCASLTMATVDQRTPVASF